MVSSPSGISTRVGSKLCGLAVCASLLVAQSARAQEVDDATRAAARRLGSTGVEAYQAHDYVTASEKLEKAFHVLQAPSLGLWSARALEKLGKLVEAQERYLKVTRLGVLGGDVQVQKKAQAEAATDLAALSPRVPAVIIRVEGATSSDVTLSIDGDSVSTELIGEARPVDPGSHKVVGVHGAEREEVEVVVAESEQKPAVLQFGVAAAALSAPPPPTAAEPHAALAADSGPTQDSGTHSGQRTVGWLTVGVGAAGLALGGATGIIALVDRGNLHQGTDCFGNDCRSSQKSKVDGYNTMRTVSTIGFIAGGALAATGIVLLLTAPRAAPAPSAALVIAPTSAGIRGTF
jgi:hypothetical protein